MDGLTNTSLERCLWMIKIAFIWTNCYYILNGCNWNRSSKVWSRLNFLLCAKLSCVVAVFWQCCGCQGKCFRPGKCCFRGYVADAAASRASEASIEAPLLLAKISRSLISNVAMEGNSTHTNDTLPPDMIFGEAQIISISAYTPLFIISAVLNLRVLRKLWQNKQRNGLSRLNQLLMHLVLADLSVRSLTYLCKLYNIAVMHWKCFSVLFFTFLRKIHYSITCVQKWSTMCNLKVERFFVHYSYTPTSAKHQK